MDCCCHLLSSTHLGSAHKLSLGGKIHQRWPFQTFLPKRSRYPDSFLQLLLPTVKLRHHQAPTPVALLALDYFSSLHLKPPQQIPHPLKPSHQLSLPHEKKKIRWTLRRRSMTPSSVSVDACIGLPCLPDHKRHQRWKQQPFWGLTCVN